MSLGRSTVKHVVFYESADDPTHAGGPGEGV